MKKTICFLTTLILTLAMAMPAMAAVSKVTVNNSNSASGGVSYSYDGSEDGEKSVKPLMTKLNTLAVSGSCTQTLTVTSENMSDKCVDFSLRLYLPVKKTYNNNDYDSLRYYNIKVTGEDGKVIYDYANAPEIEKKALYYDIPLGTLNETSAKESRTYNITVSTNKDLPQKNLASTAKQIDWCIVSAPKDKEEAKPTEAPQSTAEPTATVTPTPSSSAAPTSEPKAKADKNGEYSLGAGEYEVGKDIDADTYIITGKGAVDLYNADGKLERTVVLKSANDKDAQGTSEYTAKLSKGEKIKVQSEAKLTPKAKPTASPKASGTPKPSASPNAKSSGNSKNNPQTGDNEPVGIVIAVGILAIVGLAAITLKKKNK